MARRKWRGFAEFSMPEGGQTAIMTVCPGNPKQEGQRFRATMEAAGAKLDYLYIIEAGELGYHNLKRLVPKNEARPFAQFRGERWRALHTPFIDEFMKGRCEVLTYHDIVAETDHHQRVHLIRTIYERGNNPVTKWFDDSIDADISSRAQRKEKDGVTIEPWAIRESALDYLCDEYAMRSLMWKRFGLPEIYVDLAVHQPNLFQDQNTDSKLDLSIPPVCPITLHEVEMHHDKRLGRSFAASNSTLPTHATLPERRVALKLAL